MSSQPRRIVLPKRGALGMRTVRGEITAHCRAIVGRFSWSQFQSTTPAKWSACVLLLKPTVRGNEMAMNMAAAFVWRVNELFLYIVRFRMGFI